MTVATNCAAPQLTIGTDLAMHRIGFGAMHLTGFGMWGPPEDPDNAVRVLRRAVELGVTFIDTADAYGPGDNERIIRQALHPYPDDLVICTKGGLLRRGPQDWTSDPEDLYITPLGRPEYLRQQVELSLRNLGVERIDVYQLHSIDPAVPLADQLGELVRLREAGKIRYIGLSGQPGVTVDQLERARAITPIAVVENLLNIAVPGDGDVLRYAEQHRIAFLPWFPLGHGDLLAPGGALARVARQHGVTAAQLGIAWLLRRSPVTLPIPGTTSVAHLEENMKAGQISLSDDDWVLLEQACAAEPVVRPGVSR
jgi:pyridoxine 4-dehydrogenase